MFDLVFKTVQEADGGYRAECLAENIFAQGDTCDDLRGNVIDATAAFFFDQPSPRHIRIHLVKEAPCVLPAPSAISGRREMTAARGRRLRA